MDLDTAGLEALDALWEEVKRRRGVCGELPG
jgi:hypothetical protein